MKNAPGRSEAEHEIPGAEATSLDNARTVSPPTADTLLARAVSLLERLEARLDATPAGCACACHLPAPVAVEPVIDSTAATSGRRRPKKPQRTVAVTRNGSDVPDGSLDVPRPARIAASTSSTTRTPPNAGSVGVEEVASSVEPGRQAASAGGGAGPSGAGEAGTGIAARSPGSTQARGAGQDATPATRPQDAQTRPARTRTGLVPNLLPASGRSDFPRARVSGGPRARAQRALGLQATVDRARFDAEALRSRREFRGISAASLGRLVGTSRAQIVRWESGVDRPDEVSLMLLALALDVRPGYFAPRDPSDPLAQYAEQLLAVG